MRVSKMIAAVVMCKKKNEINFKKQKKEKKKKPKNRVGKGRWII